jgi:hypothetical protein
MKSLPVSPAKFFDKWKRICEKQKATLLAAWEIAPSYTSQIFHFEDAVIAQLATELELKVYSNYYALDAIFVAETDRVHCCPDRQNWFQDIRIAFEHENFFLSGLFQEVSHLLITRADLRVLVTYPESEDLERELRNLAKIISDSDLANSDPAFVLITGKRVNAKTDIEWRAFTYQGNELLPLKP